MKKLLLILTFVLNLCALGNSNKVTKPSKFLLREIMPKLSDIKLSDNFTFFEEAIYHSRFKAYENSKWYSKKVKSYSENDEKVNITYYSRSKLTKIVKEVVGNKKQELDIYYLDEKGLFFAIHKHILYVDIQKDKMKAIENQDSPVYTQEYFFMDYELFYMFVSEGDDEAPWTKEYLEDIEEELKKKLNLLVSKQ